MDTLNSYRKIVQDILSEYAAIPYAYGEVAREAARTDTPEEPAARQLVRRKRR